MVQLNMAIHQVFREHNVRQGTSCRLVLDLQQIILFNSRLESRDQYFLQIGFGAGSSFADFDLGEFDPEVHIIIGKEKDCQFRSLGLIVSENFTSQVVMEAVGSCLTNKYS